MKDPKVFIIILNYNGKDVIERCLTSVLGSSYLNLEIVVVDNNSTDGSLEFIKRKFSKVNFIKNSRNIGFSAGNNVGIRFALEKMADFVFILNNDAWINKDTVRELVDFSSKKSDLGVISPIIKSDKNDIWFNGGKIDWLRMKTVHLNDGKDTEYITGCAMFVRRDVFKKIGLFDEDFFLYYEDADFSVRATRAGFRLGIDRATEVFHSEKSEENNPSKIYWLVLSGLIFFKKNSPLLLHPWVKFYTFLRKEKNKRDIKKGLNEDISGKVRRAYVDFNDAM
ncbi:glycosyltransferase family 2 protein [Patescibacteria group bacterium]